jgi:hypothetical protein
MLPRRANPRESPRVMQLRTTVKQPIPPHLARRTAAKRASRRHLATLDQRLALTANLPRCYSADRGKRSLEGPRSKRTCPLRYVGRTLRQIRSRCCFGRHSSGSAERSQTPASVAQSNRHQPVRAGACTSSVAGDSRGCAETLAMLPRALRTTAKCCAPCEPYRASCFARHLFVTAPRAPCGDILRNGPSTSLHRSCIQRCCRW